MFGQLGALVNGNMFLGLLGPAIGAKVGPAEAERLAGTVDGVTTFGPAGRVLRGWITIPATILATPAADGWVRAAIDHVATLPPKGRR